MESLALTDLQIDIMRIFWRLGEATVVEVHQELQQSRSLAQPTVATLLTRLEKKGALSHRADGRQFVYRALVSERTVRRSMLSQLTHGLFDGNLPQLVSHLLASQPIDARDLEAVKALIRQKEKELEQDNK